MSCRLSVEPRNRSSTYFRACGWGHCYVLCTSGLVDDVTFSHNGPYSGMPIVHAVIVERVQLLAATLTPGDASDA